MSLLGLSCGVVRREAHGAVCLGSAATLDARARIALTTARARTRGQGTTEYAILVGVLVVIAILAITLFRPKIQELWNAIAEGINGL